MAKTTNTKKTPSTQRTNPQQAAPAASQNKSALPIIAAALFLAAYVCSALLSGTGFRPGLGTLLQVFLIAALFLRREKDLVPVAIMLVTLNSLRVFFFFFQNMEIEYYYFSSRAIMELASLSMSLITLLLALPKLRDKMRKAWWLPAALGAGILIIGTLMDAARNFNGHPIVITHCLSVYAHLFLCAWLAFPDMTFRGMIGSIQKEQETFAALMLKWLVQGVGVGIGLMVILCIMSLVDYGNLDIFLKQAVFFPTFLIIWPVAWCVVQFFVAMRQAAKETKRMKHDMNVIKSSMGGAIGAQAKAELRKEAGKKAANAVIKGALVGDLIGGDTGAVVGAMAAKAKLDQATGSDGSMSDVTKGAVVGGIVAGSSSAVVGGLAAQAQKDAEDGIK